MEQAEMKDPAVRATPANTPAIPTGSCPACGGGEAANANTPPAYIYAIGRIEPRFPRLSVEKELAQATGRSDTKGLTNRQALQAVLSEPQNRYLLRQLCWVMTVEGIETYLLIPRDPVDYVLLAEALRAAPNSMDIDVVIGQRGPIAPPEMCNGLMVPMVAFDQIYSFDRESLIQAIPRPEKTPAKEFTAAAAELFDRIMQMADNTGAADEHRALNYLAVRYHAIYEKAAQAFAHSASLTAVEVRTSLLSGTRKILDVIFSFANRNTDVVEKSFVRVDVTEEFPFLTTKLSPYFDR